MTFNANPRAPHARKITTVGACFSTKKQQKRLIKKPYMVRLQAPIHAGFSVNISTLGRNLRLILRGFPFSLLFRWRYSRGVRNKGEHPMTTFDRYRQNAEIDNFNRTIFITRRNKALDIIVAVLIGSGLALALVQWWSS